MYKSEEAEEGNGQLHLHPLLVRSLFAAALIRAVSIACLDLTHCTSCQALHQAILKPDIPFSCSKCTWNNLRLNFKMKYQVVNFQSKKVVLAFSTNTKIAMIQNKKVEPIFLFGKIRLYMIIKACLEYVDYQIFASRMYKYSLSVAP